MTLAHAAAAASPALLQPLPTASFPPTPNARNSQPDAHLSPHPPPPPINCVCRLPRSIASARSQLHATRVIADAGAVIVEGG